MRKLLTLMVALMAMGVANANAASVQSPVISQSGDDSFSETQFVDLMCLSAGADVRYDLDATMQNRGIGGIFAKLLKIRGGHRIITVVGDNVESVRVFTLGGQSVLTDRTTTVKGTGDYPDEVIIEEVEPGIYVVVADGEVEVVVVW